MWLKYVEGTWLARPTVSETTCLTTGRQVAVAKPDDKRSATASERLKRAHQAAAHDTWFREQVQASICPKPKPKPKPEQAATKPAPAHVLLS